MDEHYASPNEETIASPLHGYSPEKLNYTSNAAALDFLHSVLPFTEASDLIH